MSQRSLSYMPQLDGLRAVAIGAVFVQHFWPSYQWVKHLLPWGGLGVQLFFVLSGFLIVSILLRERERVQLGQRSLPRTLGRFYARRSLRIFPVYYLALSLGFALSLPGIAAHVGWYAAYLTNMLPLTGVHNLGAATHFWTLAIEEQFYLLVPLLILGAPGRRTLLTLLLALICLGPAYRGFAVLEGWSTAAIVHPVIACFDAFGAGALLAWASPHQRQRLILRRLGLYVGVPVTLLMLSPAKSMFGPTLLVLQPLAWTLAFVWLIDSACREQLGWAGRPLGWRPVTHIGRISYGLYVYHFMVPFVLARICQLLGFVPPKPRWTLIGTWVVLSYLAALASWHLMERPIASLKDHLTASPSHPPALPASWPHAAPLDSARAA